MKLLLTNDDGIYGQGILELTDVLKQKQHDIIVVAPDRERSATGHSITLHKPLRVTEVELDKIRDVSCYKINGTPADCVKIGLEKLTEYRPDFIISGINNGPNLGYDVLYSGTVSAAIEGFMMGYNAMAVSLVTDMYKNFKETAYKINEILEKIDLNKCNKKYLLNVNVPDKKKLINTNIKLTTLGKSIYKDFFEERVDPAGNKYYWLTGKREEKVKEGTDLWAINHKNVSLTPLKINLTDKEICNNLKNSFN